MFAALESGGEVVRVRARGGVVLSGGGFVHNRKMIADLAPGYLPGAPLGTLGDDGSAIRMGQAMGGETGEMSRVSAWRFINPPTSFASGVLVGPSGARVCNEEAYGALMGQHMVEEHQGRAWLVIDRGIWRQSHRELGPSRATWFQSVPALVNLWLSGRPPTTTTTYRRTITAFLSGAPPLRTCTVAHLNAWFGYVFDPLPVAQNLHAKLLCVYNTL